MLSSRSLTSSVCPAILTPENVRIWIGGGGLHENGTAPRGTVYAARRARANAQGFGNESDETPLWR